MGPHIRHLQGFQIPKALQRCGWLWFPVLPHGQLPEQEHTALDLQHSQMHGADAATPQEVCTPLVPALQSEPHFLCDRPTPSSVSQQVTVCSPPAPTSPPPVWPGSPHPLHPTKAHQHTAASVATTVLFPREGLEGPDGSHGVLGRPASHLAFGLRNLRPAKTALSPRASSILEGGQSQLCLPTH